MSEKEKYLIYPWNISTTQNWEMAGMEGLKNGDPKDVAKVIVEEDLELSYVSAIAEYLSHGYQRKAAEVTRALLEIEPEVISIVKSRFPKRLINDLIYVKLEELPSKPSEFPAGSIEYVQ